MLLCVVASRRAPFLVKTNELRVSQQIKKSVTIVFLVSLCCRVETKNQSHAAAKDGDIPADVVVSLMEMSDALHKGSYSLQVWPHWRPSAYPRGGAH